MTASTRPHQSATIPAAVLLLLHIAAEQAVSHSLKIAAPYLGFRFDIESSIEPLTAKSNKSVDVYSFFFLRFQNSTFRGASRPPRLMSQQSEAMACDFET
ncbi:hypothetical protein ACFX2H_036668 [Malus domestica]